MDLPSTFSFQGWDIRYKLESSKPNSSSSSQPSKTKSVVFVHGTPWSSIVYKPIIEALLAKGPYQILVYDLPGYGQSQTYNNPNTNINNSPPPPPSPSQQTNPQTPTFQGNTSIKFQSHALTALLTHVKLNSKPPNPTPSIIAHDIAGSIILRTHLIHSINFNSILLADTNAVLPWGDGFYKLVRSTPKPFLDLPSGIFEAMVRAVTRSACYDHNVLKAGGGGGGGGGGWEDALVTPWIGSESKQTNFIRQIAQADDSDIAEMLDGDMYKRIRCDNIKILWGEEDQWIPREKIEELVTRIGGERVKEVVFVPEAGHLLMLDQPVRWALEVFDWLGREEEGR